MNKERPATILIDPEPSTIESVLRQRYSAGDTVDRVAVGVDPAKDATSDETVYTLLQSGTTNLTRDEAMRRGLVMMTRRELEELAKMNPLQKTVFMAKKLAEHNRQQKVVNHEILAEMKVHPLAGMDEAERRQARSARKRKRRSRR